MRVLIAEAIKQGITAGMQQTRQARSVASEFCMHPGQHQTSQPPREFSALQGPCSPASSRQSQSLFLEEEGQKNLQLSEDEGLIPDQPAFAGLFCLSLFKPLLFMAKNTARLGAIPATSDPALELANPADSLFPEPTTETEVVPAPKLFIDVVQRQWASPGSGPSPSTNDRKYYNMAPELVNTLQVLVINGPVVALASSSVISHDPEDALKAAWAVKAL